MVAELLSLFKDHLFRHSQKDPWMEACKQWMGESGLTPSLFILLFEKISLPPTSSKELNEKLKGYLSLLLLIRDNPDQVYHSKLRHSFLKIPLSSLILEEDSLYALYSLIAHLLDIPFSLSNKRENPNKDPTLKENREEKESGEKIEPSKENSEKTEGFEGKQSDEKKSPFSLEKGDFSSRTFFEKRKELAIYWYILGEIYQEESIKRKAFSLMKWQCQFFDGENAPFPTLWEREESYIESEALSIHYLFLFCLSTVYKQEDIKRKKELIFSKLQSLIKNGSISFPYFFILIFSWVEKLAQASPKGEVSKEPFSIETKGLSWVKYSQEHFHAALTLSGANTGLGVIRSQEVAILSFGPQFFPLNNLAGFGIQRGFDLCDERFQDLKVTSGREKACLEGWTALSHKEKSPWMKFSGTIEKKRCFMDFYFLEKSHPLALAFYIKAPICKIGGRQVKPATLHRYLGPVEQVSFIGKKTSLMIKASGSQPMHLIPLAGASQFWGADFLLAYEVGEEAQSKVEVLESQL